MLHQRTGAGADPAGNKNLAAGRTVSRGVTTVTEDRQFSTGVQPTGICRGRTFNNNLGPFKTERTDTLAWVFDPELQRSPIFSPERATDIMMTG